MKKGPRLSIPLLILLVFLNSGVQSQERKPTPAVYQPLLSRLSADGFDLELISKIFTDPRAEIIPERMVLSFVSRETTELYQKFLTPESLSVARTFLRQNQELLRKMESQYHVDKEVVVAILLVESRFGENIGKHRVIPTLASMALIHSPENLEKNYLSLRQNNPDLSYQEVENLGKKRGEWAYQELKCFLRIIRSEETDPLEIYGSYAGALGMAQFLPSSYLAYSVNEKTFKDWLLGKEEAILSIGNYLSAHGWKKKMTMERKKKVLWTYNHSQPYIETILQIAQKIKANPNHQIPNSK